MPGDAAFRVLAKHRQARRHLEAFDNVLRGAVPHPPVSGQRQTAARSGAGPDVRHRESGVPADADQPGASVAAVRLAAVPHVLDPDLALVIIDRLEHPVIARPDP